MYLHFVDFPVSPELVEVEKHVASEACHDEAESKTEEGCKVVDMKGVHLEDKIKREIIINVENKTCQEIPFCDDFESADDSVEIAMWMFLSQKEFNSEDE